MPKPKTAANDTAPAGHNSAQEERDRKVLFFIGRKNYLAALKTKKEAATADELIKGGADPDDDDPFDDEDGADPSQMAAE